MLELKDICKQYDEKAILDHISISFPDTGLIGIQGTSGCGKSTLLYIIGLLDDDYQGDIVYNGEKIKDKKAFICEHISFMMQNKDFISSLTVKENIILPNHISHIYYTPAMLKKIVSQLDIQDLLSRYPFQLSGGQRKRASLAKTLLKQSDIILCDEPTGALYHEQAKEVMKYLKKISQNALVIIVSHDSQLIQDYCDSVLTLEKGVLKGRLPKTKKSLSYSKKHQHHSLWFYPLRQLFFQRNKLMFLFLFQWIVIVAFFVIVTAMFGVFDAIEDSEQQAVLKNVMYLENKDGRPFETMPVDQDIASIGYNYQLEQCQVYVSQKEWEGTLFFLPDQTSHIVLKEGRFPQTKYEVIVSYSFDQKYPNQKIEITYQQKHLTLSVVGVLQKDFFTQEDIYLEPSFQQDIPELMNSRELIVESSPMKNKDLYQKLSVDYHVYSEIIERIESYQTLLSLAQLVAVFFIGISLVISLLLLGLVESIIYFERKHDVAYLLSLGISSQRLLCLSLIEAFLLGMIISVGGSFLSVVVYIYLNSVIDIESLLSFSLSLKPVFFSKYDIYFFIFFIYLCMSILSVLHPIHKMMKVHKIEVLREE